MAETERKSRRRTRFSAGWAALAGACCWLPCGPATADPPAAAEAKPADWSRGALFGRVADAATGKPLADATVALQNKDGKVLAWTKTDAQGQYALAADSLAALQLRPSRRRGLLERMARGVGQVAAAPVKAVVGAVKQVDPVATGKAAVASAVTGNPLPLASPVANVTAGALAGQASASAREAASKAVLGERQATPRDKRKTLAPGEVFLAVSAPGFQELQEKVGAYWLEPPAPASADGGSPATGVRAWLETVKLAPAGVADRRSEVENGAVLLAEGRAEPALAAAGAPIRLSVRLVTPGDRPLKARVFAREDRKKTVVELKPAEGGAPNVFTGELPLDAGLSPGETVVTLVALRAEPIEVKIKGGKEDPLRDFARGLDDLDADKPYEFDPRILASENRLDLKVTVLDPKRAVAPGGDGRPSSAIPAP